MFFSCLHMRAELFDDYANGLAFALVTRVWRSHLRCQYDKNGKLTTARYTHRCCRLVVLRWQHWPWRVCPVLTASSVHSQEVRWRPLAAVIYTVLYIGRSPAPPLGQLRGHELWSRYNLLNNNFYDDDVSTDSVLAMVPERIARYRSGVKINWSM